MKLIDLLVQELPKRGGWPEGYDVVSTNGYGAVWAYKTKGRTAGRELYFHSTTEGHVTSEQYEAALAASQKVEWDGVGLPPVGCECDALMPRSAGEPWEWRKVKVVASGIKGAENECLVYDVENLRPTWVDEFRPILSEADKKREEAIDAMLSVFGSNAATGTATALKAIYDAIKSGQIVIE